MRLVITITFILIALLAAAGIAAAQTSGNIILDNTPEREGKAPNVSVSPYTITAAYPTMEFRFYPSEARVLCSRTDAEGNTTDQVFDTVAIGLVGHVWTAQITETSWIEINVAEGRTIVWQNCVSTVFEHDPEAWGYSTRTNPPSLYELGHGASGQAPKFLPFSMIRDNPRQAGVLYDVIGFSALTVGGILRGKAEHHSRYHGTSGDLDNFHVTRDAGLVITGLGAASLGTASACNILDGRPGTWLRILNRAVFGLFWSRLTAEAAYRAMPNRYK